MNNLAHRTVLDVGLCKLVGMKVEGLYDKRDREQAEADSKRPALGWRQVCGITSPDSHFLDLLLQLDALGDKRVICVVPSAPKPTGNHTTRNILR